MGVKAVIGTQWGDEGKGKIVDFLAENSDLVVRFQGGSNAGHTVKVGNETFKFHLLPSGVIRGKVGIIANGVVFDPEIFLEEVENLRKRRIEPNVIVSDRANVVMPYHKILDGAEEEFLGKRKIGTTKRGIGPCYSDKVARRGIRVGDLLDRDELYEKLERVYSLKSEILKIYDIKMDYTLDELVEKYHTYGKKLKPYVRDTVFELNKAIKEGKEILLEGAQGVMLDVDFGTYPYVTSSNTISGGACTGSGIPPKYIDKVIGVMKSYTTRVGEGPFPTELKDEIGRYLQEKGEEFGTTTGRSRRCGWLDLVVAKFSCMVCGIDEIAITKLDVLDGFKSVKVCVGYDYNGKILESFPANPNILNEIKPVYEEFDGWKSTKNIRCFEFLPKEAKQYIKFIEDFLDIPISIISVGPERDRTIFI